MAQKLVFTDDLASGTLPISGLGVTYALAAASGGTQATGTAVPPNADIVTVSAASSGYSITLPPAVPGNEVDVLLTSSGNTVKVFPNAADNNGAGGYINALGQNAAITMSALTSATFTCTTLGQWYTNPRVPS